MCHDRTLVGERAPAVANMKGDDNAEVKRENCQQQQRKAYRDICQPHDGI